MDNITTNDRIKAILDKHVSIKSQTIDYLEDYAQQIYSMIRRTSEINDENEKAFLEIGQKLSSTISSLVLRKESYQQFRSKVQEMDRLNRSSFTPKSMLWSKISTMLLPLQKELWPIEY